MTFQFLIKRFCFLAIPVGIIIQETRGTTDLLLETIPTGITPVPGMITGQCPEDTGMTITYISVV